ncbi:MAG: ABC-F family ATP-binding cassette domain-containing protein [Clostridia bacterium]|nr:ABC-F family ATP-binding cassette domain-containing protein [Clostridia bacterium]
MVILSVNGITVEYGTDVVLHNIGFSINEGDRLGIVGVNGAGKSTLLRIIAGEQEPSAGNVFVSKGHRVAMLEQNAMLESEKTVYDEMLSAFDEQVKAEEKLDVLSREIERRSGDAHDDLYNSIISEYSALTERFKNIGGYEYKSRIRSMLSHFGFDDQAQERRISSLSGGERTRLALVRLLLQAPDILMLDEPTNHLDTKTLEWLESHLCAYPKTLIVVSHDRYFLDRVATKMLDIEHTEATIYTGNYTAFATQKAEAQKTLARKYEHQQKEIARIEGIIAKQRHFGQERNFITIASKQKQIEHMEKIDAPKAAPKNIKMSFRSAGESGNEVIVCENIEKSFGAKKVLHDLSFLVRRGDRVVVIGPNGCGKSTLIKIIDGQLEADGGVCEFGANTVIGYYDQEQKTLDDERTVLEELVAAHDKLTYTELRTALARFLFFAEDIDKKVGTLSGGERARLMLCKMILSRVNVLILDEPTNHLDIGSREALESALLEFDGTIVAVSHDRYFINKISTRIFDMTNGFEDFRGGYEEYLIFKQSRELSEGAASVKEDNQSIEKFKYINNKKLLSDIRRARTKMERSEQKIEELEAKKSDLEAESAGSAATDYVRLSEIAEEMASIDAELETLYNDYAEAEEELKRLGEKP